MLLAIKSIFITSKRSHYSKKGVKYYRSRFVVYRYCRWHFKASKMLQESLPCPDVSTQIEYMILLAQRIVCAYISFSLSAVHYNGIVFVVRNKIQIRWVIQASQLPDAEIQSSKDLIVVPPHLNERTYRWMGPFWNLITELFHFNLFRCEWKVHSLFYLYSILRYTSTESITVLHKSYWMKWDESWNEIAWKWLFGTCIETMLFNSFAKTTAKKPTTNF